MTALAFQYKYAPDYCNKKDIPEETFNKFRDRFAYFNTMIDICDGCNTNLTADEIEILFNRLYFIHINALENYNKTNVYHKQLLLKWYNLQNDFNNDELVCKLVDAQVYELCNTFVDLKDKLPGGVCDESTCSE